MGVQQEPIWDGNGGQLDPQKAPQRDLLVALHVKMDSVVIPQLKELNEWRRDQDGGNLTRGQEAAIRSMLQGDQDARADRRNSRLPFVAVVISVLALAPSVVLMIAAFSGGSL